MKNHHLNYDEYKNIPHSTVSATWSYILLTDFYEEIFFEISELNSVVVLLF